MPDAARPVDEVALDWVIRMRDPSFTDWDGLTAWLEARPAHAQAFDRLSLADEALDAELAPAGELHPQAPAPGARRQVGPRSFAGGAARRTRRSGGAPLIWRAAAAVAACLLVSFGLWRPGGPLRDPTELYVAGDQARLVSWGDRGEVDLAPGARLSVDRRTGSVARLEEGRATFRIRHDPTRRVVVEVGAARVVDIGTVFVLQRRRDGLDLAVSEGRVRYEAGDRQVVVGAGQRLTASGGKIEVTGAEGGAPQARRPLRLTYDRAPLGRVAADLSRNAVLAVRVDPAIAGQTFTGTIALDGDAAAVRRRVQLLLGVSLKPEGRGWVMTAAGARAAAD